MLTKATLSVGFTGLSERKTSSGNPALALGGQCLAMSHGSNTRRGRYIPGLALCSVIAGSLVAACAQASSATQLVVTLPNQVFVGGLGNVGAPASQTAGVAFGLTLTAVD